MFQGVGGGGGAVVGSLSNLACVLPVSGGGGGGGGAVVGSLSNSACVLPVSGGGGGGQWWGRCLTRLVFSLFQGVGGGGGGSGGVAV